MARKYTGVTPDGKICYLEKGSQPDPSFVSGVLESPTLIEQDSGSDVEPVTSEKGSNSGSFSGSNSGSQRGSDSDPLKGSPPPKEYISNPPPLPNERENRAREPIQKNLDLKIDDSYIEGPGFRIDLQAVDIAAALTGYKHDARKLAELMARDWVANNFTPESPMGKIRWAMKNDHNDDQQQSARREKIQNGTNYRGGSSSRKSNDEYADQDAAAAAANRVMERLKADAACN